MRKVHSLFSFSSQTSPVQCFSAQSFSSYGALGSIFPERILGQKTKVFLLVLSLGLWESNPTLKAPGPWNFLFGRKQEQQENKHPNGSSPNSSFEIIRKDSSDLSDDDHLSSSKRRKKPFKTRKDSRGSLSPIRLETKNPQEERLSFFRKKFLLQQEESFADVQRKAEGFFPRYTLQQSEERKVFNIDDLPLCESVNLSAHSFSSHESDKKKHHGGKIQGAHHHAKEKDDIKIKDNRNPHDILKSLLEEHPDGVKTKEYQGWKVFSCLKVDSIESDEEKPSFFKELAHVEESLNASREGHDLEKIINPPQSKRTSVLLRDISNYTSSSLALSSFKGSNFFQGLSKKFLQQGRDLKEDLTEKVQNLLHRLEVLEKYFFTKNKEKLSNKTLFTPKAFLDTSFLDTLASKDSAPKETAETYHYPKPPQNNFLGNFFQFLFPGTIEKTQEKSKENPRNYFQEQQKKILERKEKLNEKKKQWFHFFS